jgi:hypothetical protein
MGTLEEFPPWKARAAIMAFAPRAGGDVYKIVDATFKRNGCGENMKLDDYLREVKARNL